MSNEPVGRRTRQRGGGSANPDAVTENEPLLDPVLSPANAPANQFPDQPPAWLTHVIQATIAAAIAPNQAQEERIRQLEERLANNSLADKLDESLLRQLSAMPMFDGSDARPWEDFEQEFRNKASQIRSLPRGQWVRYMHSRICDRALEYAKSKNLVNADNELQTSDFEHYCKMMAEAMFGDTLSKTAKVQALAAMTQTGKLKNVMDFLRAKEKLLNQIPQDDMAGYVRAALAMMGMDQGMVAAISPNPTSPDGLFHCYADVRKQVVAALALNQQIYSNVQQPQTSQQNQSTQQPQSYNKDKQKGNGAAVHNRFDKGSTPMQAQPAQGVKRSHTAAVVSSSPAPSGSARQAGAPPPKPADPRFANAICKDCGQKGHGSAAYFRCPKSTRNQSKGSDGK